MYLPGHQSPQWWPLELLSSPQHSGLSWIIRQIVKHSQEGANNNFQGQFSSERRTEARWLVNLTWQACRILSSSQYSPLLSPLDVLEMVEDAQSWWMTMVMEIDYGGSCWCWGLMKVIVMKSASVGKTNARIHWQCLQILREDDF